MVQLEVGTSKNFLEIKADDHHSYLGWKACSS